MDYHSIVAQAYILNNEFSGKLITASRLFEKTLFLGFEGGQGLKLACTPGMPYLHTLETRYIPVKKSKDWHLREFSGKKLTGISVFPGDRVVEFSLSSGAKLIFEMTGRHTNIIILDPDNIITGVLRHVSSKDSTYREVRRGIPYIPPPSRDYIDPLISGRYILDSSLEQEGTLADILKDRLCAGSTVCAKEAALRAGLEETRESGDISQQEKDKLWEVLYSMLGLIAEGGEGGTLIYTANSVPKDVFPLKLVSVGEEFREWFADINEAMMKYGLEREYQLERAALTKQIESSLNKEERNIRSTIEKVRSEMGGDTEPENLEKIGNIILANSNSIKRGMDKAVLNDPYTGELITIKLDPSKDASANAGKFFVRARKLRSASVHAQKRILHLESRLENLSGQRAEFQQTESLRELRKLAAFHQRFQSAKGEQEETTALFPKRYISPSGLQIIVGRNDRENDQLLKWAGREDLWLHAQNIPGSHVILKSPSRTANPDQASVQLAASIAAFHSKARTSALVPVVVTKLKYVVKKRGQGPGQVTYTREKVVFAEPGEGK